MICYYATDQKRDALHIRGPVNLNGTIHMCMKNEAKAVEKEQVKQPADLDVKELGLTKAIQELTSTINNLIYCYCASTKEERQIIKKRIAV
jgi:hypothetical protein